MIHTEEELCAYQARTHAKMAKVQNNYGEPEPNFSVRIPPDEYRQLREQLLRQKR